MLKIKKWTSEVFIAFAIEIPLKGVWSINACSWTCCHMLNKISLQDREGIIIEKVMKSNRFLISKLRCGL